VARHPLQISLLSFAKAGVERLLLIYGHWLIYTKFSQPDLGVTIVFQLKEAKVSASVLSVALALVAGGTIYGAISILASFGFESIFAPLNMSDTLKLVVGLYMTGSAISLALSAFAVYMVSKGQVRKAGYVGISAAVLVVITALSPSAFSVQLGYLALSVLLVAAVMSALGGVVGLSSPVISPMEPLLTTTQVANSAVLSALTAIFTGIAFVPSPTGGYTHLGDTIIFIAALLFGSRVGGLTGAIGSVAADLWVGYPRWFVSIPAHGLEGLLAGLGKRRSLAVQVISCALGGFAMASTYFYVNIFIKGWAPAIISYARDLFGQAAVSIILGIVLVKAIRKLVPRLRA
jgi:uncharacterized membrane protein